MGPVNKDHPWERNNIVFVHRWSLIAGSFKQNMSNLETKSKVAVDRESLFVGTGLTVITYPLLTTGLYMHGKHTKIL